MKLNIKTLKVTNGIIESKKTKEIVKDNVKQLSFTNSLKDTENNLYARRFVRMRWTSIIDGGYCFYPQAIEQNPVHHSSSHTLQADCPRLMDALCTLCSYGLDETFEILNW